MYVVGKAKYFSMGSNLFFKYKQPNITLNNRNDSMHHFYTPTTKSLVSSLYALTALVFFLFDVTFPLTLSRYFKLKDPFSA